VFAIRLARQRAVPSFVAATTSAATAAAAAAATSARTLLVLAVPRCGARFVVAAIVLITGTGFRTFSAGSESLGGSWLFSSLRSRWIAPLNGVDRFTALLWHRLRGGPSAAKGELVALAIAATLRRFHRFAGRRSGRWERLGWLWPVRLGRRFRLSGGCQTQC